MSKYVLVYEKDTDGELGISRLVRLRSLPMAIEAIRNTNQLGGVKKMYKNSKFYTKDVVLEESDLALDLYPQNNM